MNSRGLQPIPKEGLTAMKRALEDIARKKCEVAKRRFDQANKVPPGMGMNSRDDWMTYQY